MPVPAAIPLVYADRPERWGVSADHSPEVTRVSVAPPGFRQVLHLYRIPIISLTVVLSFTTGMPLLFRPIEWGIVLANALVYGTPLLLVAALACDRLRRRLAFEITADHFAFTTLSGSKAQRMQSWPRSDIGDVHFNPYSRKLVIRVTGKDLVELFVSPEARVTEHVASILNEALYAPPVRQGHSTQHRNDAPPRRPRRWPGVTLGALVMATDVTICFLDFPLAPCGIYVAIGGIAVLGITFGSQDQKFWC